jgi:hypothetical protein
MPADLSELECELAKKEKEREVHSFNVIYKHVVHPCYITVSS